MFDLMPFGRNDRNLFRYLDNMEKSFFGDMASDFPQFRTDIIDKGDKYVLEAELPGFTKEDINIDIQNDRLIVSAEHNENTEEKKENFVRKERRYGSFSRSFDISSVKADEITDEYKNGILELNLPKKSGEVPASRRIEIQ
jgi:HSP20 family protein